VAARLKVLLSAYACEPNRGSEPEAGWQWATRLAQTHDITVVTRANNQQAIEAGLAKLPQPHLKFIYYDLPLWLRHLKQHGLSVSWYYVLWQIGVWWHLRRRVAAFDYIHHVTFNSYRWAGVWWLTNRPLILGPLGGGQICPPAFLKLFGRSAWLERLRSRMVRGAQYNPLHRFNCRHARRILVANRDTMARLPKAVHDRTEFMLDAGITAGDSSAPNHPLQPAGRLRLIWVGVLQARKGLPLALQALAVARHACPQITLTVVGTGPELSAAQAIAAKLGLTEAVTWSGWKARGEVADLLHTHDGFLFTSVRDTSGYVLLEAMLAGLPVITLNHQGAAEMTTDETALRITPATFAATVTGLAHAMTTLANDPDQRQRLGQAGRKHVLQHHTWEQRFRQMNSIYAQLAQELESNPPPGTDRR
jgi:glycosyltransferase involved in cell wall biosynthesis